MKTRKMTRCNLNTIWGEGFIPELWSRTIYGEACSIEEYAFLFGLTALLRPDKILEIGTSQGLGSVSMALGAQLTGNKCHIVTIDKTKMEFEKNFDIFSECKEVIEFRQGDSTELLSEMLKNNEFYDLCFIDGGHDYETVNLDWEYAKQLANTWIFHDSDTECGVAKLISEISKTENYVVSPFHYKPGRQLDDLTGEWYTPPASPGLCLVKFKK